MPNAHEVNFDALVGLTHNYAGLSPGNIASATHAGAKSSPRGAAKQGLRKMKMLADLGFKQGVLVPQERPDVRTLRSLGFGGTDEQVLKKAAAEAPALLSACCSASSMWVANAATVSPSADTADGRVHLTPANLVSHFHRSIEPATTTRVLRSVFADEKRFCVHEPLPATPAFADEGAANHMRLCRSHGEAALEGFVYGRRGIEKASVAGETVNAGPKKFPARQTIESFETIARRHGLDSQAAASKTVFVQQNAAAIDQGVFHNDVIAVANERVLFYHEEAFVPAEEKKLLDACRSHLGDAFVPIRVPTARVSVADAVKTYLFNSQLLTRPDGTGMMLVCPMECEEHAGVKGFIDEVLLSDGTPIVEARYVDVRQSMNNGGGPACLRLRVVLTEAELAAANRGVFLDDALFSKLDGWIDRHYRDELFVSDLVDPKLVTEGRDALDELTRILGLGRVYHFQS